MRAPILFPSLLALAALAGAPAARAVTTVLYGPSPYFAASDSPFYAGIQAGTIYLEDFEDHALNTPNVIANDINVNPNNGWISTTVRTNNPNAGRANSVDADDGLLGDFRGFAGDALTNNGVFDNPYQHEFLFTPDAMGRYPTYVGFVVTDPEDFLEASVKVNMREPVEGDDVIEDNFNPDLWDPDFPGDTRAHRFIGAYSSGGIAFLRIEGVDELDHLQYGYAIPEPAAAALLLAAATAALLRRRR